ncbi:MAG: helix-turn-helix transcriptional regulator [Chloracidobacterium sp.]|nr:helix-turn-helix transcriptional regulator [Chloracidobacterium sp.]
MRVYGIARYIKRTSNDVPQVEEGSLYPALQRLAIKGWVNAEWGQSENNHRALPLQPCWATTWWIMGEISGRDG